MNASTQSRQLTRKQKVLAYLAYLLALTVLFVACAEAVLRFKGILPWRYFEVATQVDPGGKFFKKHETLGYSHIPGPFEVTLGTGYTFNVTHLPNTLRITHPTDDRQGTNRKGEIWIFGCSYTYGWSINDDETYPWLLQERFPEYDVINFGVNGYGTIHSLLQLRDALRTKAPEIIVLAYSESHDARNTFARVRRKAIAPWNRLGPLQQPYARMADDGGLQHFVGEVEYEVFPLMRYSALAHYAEIRFNRLEVKWLHSRAVSEALVTQMAQLAKEHEVTFIIANIVGEHSLTDYAEENGIPAIDISVDLLLPENSNRPHDAHPSALANQIYADRLGDFLRAELGE